MHNKVAACEYAPLRSWIKLELLLQVRFSYSPLYLFSATETIIASMIKTNVITPKIMQNIVMQHLLPLHTPIIPIIENNNVTRPNINPVK